MEKILERNELVISMYSMHQAKSLKRFGDIQFISPRMHYVILYVEADQTDEIIRQLKKIRSVKHVEIAPTPELAVQLNEANLIDEEDELQ